METCYRCGTREIVDSLPDKKIYGLWEEDCRQVILRADYEN